MVLPRSGCLKIKKAIAAKRRISFKRFISFTGLLVITFAEKKSMISGFMSSDACTRKNQRSIQRVEPLVEFPKAIVKRRKPKESA
jgi:hypothetical protein